MISPSMDVQVPAQDCGGSARDCVNDSPAAHNRSKYFIEYIRAQRHFNHNIPNYIVDRPD
jgi:hypothetical protein